MRALSPVSVIGDNSNPYAGRIWVRDFPYGDFEALYRSHARAPSEVERINTWLALDGSDNRVSARGVYGVSVRDGSSGSGESLQPSETNAERVARRAKQKLRWNVKCIGADRLLTLTFRDNVEDFVQADSVLTRFLRLCRGRWGAKWRFSAVPELQARGCWHFHLAVRGWWDVHRLRGFWWKACGARVSWSTEGRPVLEDASQTPGNVDITNPRKRRCWSVDKLAAYLSKYVAKAVGENNLGGRPSYRCTRGLHPQVTRFVVRGLTFSDVVQEFLGVVDVPGQSSPFLWQSADRSVLWASGLKAPPQPPQ